MNSYTNNSAFPRHYNTNSNQYKTSPSDNNNNNHPSSNRPTHDKPEMVMGQQQTEFAFRKRCERIDWRKIGEHSKFMNNSLLSVKNL